MTIFQCLSIEKVIDLFLAVLIEWKIILVSKFRPVLMEVAEVLTCLIFPMQYQGMEEPALAPPNQRICQIASCNVCECADTL